MAIGDRGGEVGGIPTCEGTDPLPRRPAVALPPGSCDAHMHVFGPATRYGFTADRSYTPPEAPLERYEALARTLGIHRMVVVQPSVYGTDNRCTLDAVRDTELDARAVVVIADDTTDAELERMHAAGARGIRVNLSFRGGIDLDTAESLATRVAGLGWHVEVLADISTTPGLAGFVGGIGLPVVFDHMGHIPASRGIGHPAFQTLLALLREGQAWVKLSGAYRTTGERIPPYGDVLPYARALIEANPDRCVWATDWPHPAVSVPMPNDGDLVDMLADWVPEAGLRRRILVENPARLYGFAAGN